MKQFKYLCLSFLFMAAEKLHGQDISPLPLKKVPVNTINYEQGLLNNETAAIITDTLGFTWISTTTGLQRYNGFTFENINPVVDRDTIRIRSRVYIYGLKNGDLWISCKKGILEYDPFTNIFKNVIPVSCSAGEAFAIVPLNKTPEGIWCLKKGAGMVIYDERGKLKKTISSINKNILDGLIVSDYVRSSNIIVSNNDHIFIRTAPKRILDYNTTDHHFENFTVTDDIFSIACNSRFLYISGSQSVSKFQISDKRLTGIYPFKNITRQAAIGGCVYAIGNNRVMAGVNDQVIEFDADLHNPKLLTTFNGRPLLSTGFVEHIYHDAFDRIWLLTNDDIKRIQDKQIPFDYLKYPDADNNFVRCLYFDKQTGQLLAGCINGGLQVYDRSSNPLWHKPLLTKDFKDILAIEKLSANTYLVITWSKGWYLLDLLKRKLTAFDFPPGNKFKSLLYENIFSSNVQRLNDSTLLVTSVSNVFRCIFHGNTLVMVKPLLPVYKSFNDRISCAYYASDSTLWIGQYNGSVSRMEKNKKAETINQPEKSFIRCFAEDANHHIWIGTSSGLYACTLTGLILKGFYIHSGLLNDCIYSILPLPGNSSVIASSNMGLSDVALNGNIKNYTKELGLQDNEFNTAAALVTNSGKFYFGGVNGITSFYPSVLIDRQNKPILNITKLVVNDSSYNSAGILKGNTIRLKYNQNHIQFDFAAMGPLNADKYFYKYRLIGFEKNWQSTHEPIGIRYILQPGSYTLQVACSDELAGPEVKKSITIIIDPPFWLRWWFFAIMGVCAIGAVAMIVTFYNRRRYEKALQEVLVKQQLQHQREQISRDLHDNLGAQANAIFYGTELLMRQTDDREKLIDNLHDTAGDMLTVLRETLWAMKITQVEATDLWLRILNFTRKLGTYYPGMTMAAAGAAPAGLALTASMALNMILIVQEAITNAVRHSEASTISINSYYNDNLWRIEIMDDGKGFDVASVSGKAESYGLENMAERAGGSNIAFDINSLPSHGTKVYLEIDINKMNHN